MLTDSGGGVRTGVLEEAVASGTRRNAVPALRGLQSSPDGPIRPKAEVVDFEETDIQKRRASRCCMASVRSIQRLKGERGWLRLPFVRQLGQPATAHNARLVSFSEILSTRG